MAYFLSCSHWKKTPVRSSVDSTSCFLLFTSIKYLWQFPRINRLLTMFILDSSKHFNKETYLFCKLFQCSYSSFHKLISCNYSSFNLCLVRFNCIINSQYYIIDITHLIVNHDHMIQLETKTSSSSRIMDSSMQFREATRPAICKVRW